MESLIIPQKTQTHSDRTIESLSLIKKNLSTKNLTLKTKHSLEITHTANLLTLKSSQTTGKIWRDQI